VAVRLPQPRHCAPRKKKNAFLCVLLPNAFFFFCGAWGCYFPHRLPPH
jgi:hypothetical protein